MANKINLLVLTCDVSVSKRNRTCFWPLTTARVSITIYKSGSPDFSETVAILISLLNHVTNNFKKAVVLMRTSGSV